MHTGFEGDNGSQSDWYILCIGAYRSLICIVLRSYYLDAWVQCRGREVNRLDHHILVTAKGCIIISTAIYLQASQAIHLTFVVRAKPRLVPLQQS